MYKLEWHQSVESIPEQLWQQCFASPYEGKWWYAALERAGLDSQFKFMYGLVSFNDQPVAIAPAFLMDVPIALVIPPALLPIFNLLGKLFPSLLFQRTFFIGSPCSDEGRVGLVEGADAGEVFACINKAMRTQADALGATMRVWKDFAEEQASALIPLLKRDGLFHLVSFPGTTLQLAGNNKDDYMASLKASRRNKLKKKMKQANEAPVFVEILSQPSAEVMDEIFALFWQTYEKGNTKFEQLNRRFFDEISSYQNSHYVILRKNQSKEMLCFMLCFKLGEHVVNKFIGIDYKQPKEWFLYFRLWDAAVEWSYSVGATSIQSGQTGYAPKIELGNDMVALSNYCQHQNPIVNFIYQLVAKTINWDTLDADLAIYVKAYPEFKPVNLN
ncbi:MAG: peptidogalycan biosysnthesis protein [Candidatus Methylopumilus sp.]